MVTLLASVVGFITSIIPEFVKLMKEKHENNHKLKMIEKHIAYSRISKEHRLDELFIRSDLQESILLSRHGLHKTGIGWIDVLNATVRPLMTYCFFGLYVYFKLLQYQHLSSTMSIVEYMEIVWSIDDQAIFASITSFYFGQRTFSKLYGRS